MRKQMQAVGLDDKLVLVDTAYGGRKMSTIRQLFTDFGIDYYLLPESPECDPDFYGCCEYETHTTSDAHGYLRLCD